jgi:hypothetical protein
MNNLKPKACQTRSKSIKVNQSSSRRPLFGLPQSAIAPLGGATAEAFSLSPNFVVRFADNHGTLPEVN